MRIVNRLFCMVIASVIISGCSQSGGKHDAISTIMNRKSVRSYTGEAVPKEKIDILLKAGMAAPTAMDKRPWEFIVVTDRDVLKKLADALPYAKMTAKAGAAIIVAGDTKRQFGGEDSSIWIMDCSAASENILLAAEAQGLGAVWTALYPSKENVKAVTRILGIPKHVIPLNLIPVGIPGGSPKAKDKFDPARIHRDKW